MRIGAARRSRGPPSSGSLHGGARRASEPDTPSQLLGVELPLGLEGQELGRDDANEWITRHWDAFIAME